MENKNDLKMYVRNSLKKLFNEHLQQTLKEDQSLLQDDSSILIDSKKTIIENTEEQQDKSTNSFL